MAEYIEVGELFTRVKEVLCVHPHKGEVFELIETCPTADVVAVTRCGECKDVDRGVPDVLWCTGRGWPYQMVSPDGYCDKGKRGTDD